MTPTNLTIIPPFSYHPKYHSKKISAPKSPSFDDDLSLELLDGRDSVALSAVAPCAAACARNWRMRATGLLAELGGSKAERSRFMGSSHMAAMRMWKKTQKGPGKTHEMVLLFFSG